jgi:gluconokinase
MKIPGLRSDSVQIGGLVYFGRMLDKIRLKAAGKLPADYFTGTTNRTHFDARCCHFLNIDYDALVERVLRGGTDEEILVWCYEKGTRPTEEQIEVWNQFLAKRGWRDAGSEELKSAKAERGFASRDDILTWFDLHLAEES